MAAPQLRVFVDFDSDTAFETNPLILGSATKGILGTNRLGSGTLPVEVTDLVTRCNIRRGRNRINGQFEFGSASLKRLTKIHKHLLMESQQPIIITKLVKELLNQIPQTTDPEQLKTLTHQLTLQLMYKEETLGLQINQLKAEVTRLSHL